MRTPLPATVLNRSPHSPTTANRWKTLLAALGLGLMSTLPAQAQLNYTTAGFSNISGSWTTLYGDPGATSMVGDLQNSDPDDDITFDQPIGFTFNYQGVDYTRFILGTNGFIKLGTIEPAYFGGTSAGSTAGSILRETDWENNNSIAPFNFDVVPGSLGQNDYLRKVTGAPGSRVLTIEWHDVSEYTSPAQFNSLSFQLKLYEGSNRIEFVYGPSVVGGTSTLKVGNAGLRGQSPLSNQVLFISKASGAAWSAAAAANPTAASGGYGGGAFAANALNYRSIALPAVGQTFRFNPVAANTNNVSVAVYTLSQVANPQGMPHAVKARLTNETATATGPFNVHLDVSGTLTIGGTPTPFNFTDDRNVTTPGFAGDPRPQITFDPYTVPLGATGNLTVTVTANNAGDQVPANNTASFTTSLSTTSNSYATTAPIAGGSGFTGAFGEFVARFKASTPQEIEGVRVEFATSGRSYKLIILDDNGLGGTPGTVLYASPSDLTSDATSPQLIPVLPALTVSGDFYVGIRQTSVNNIGFGYETESPVRGGDFFYRGSATNNPPTNAWTDYADAGSPFRPIATVVFAVPTNLPPNCASLTSPADNATGVITSGLLQWGSGGGSPTGFKVYLSTNQNAVINEAPSALVATTASTQYAFSGLSGLTTYYWKVVPTNANGDAPSCFIRSFTTDVAPPTNDNCSSSRLIFVKNFGDCGTLSNQTQGTTAGATEDAIADPTCSGGVNADVWYRFNTGSTRAVIVNTTLGTATQVGWELFSACGTPVAGACVQIGTGAFSIGGLQRNTEYRLRMFTTRTLDLDGVTPGVQAPVAGTFSVCVSKPTSILHTTGTATLPAGDYGDITVQGGTLIIGGSSTSNDVVVMDGATLNVGNNILSGGRFTLMAGGTLGIGSTSGITPLGSNSGSIQFDILRSYSNDANYVYTNSLPGTTGAGMPSMVRSLTTAPSNAASLGLTNSVSIRRMLTLNGANLNVGASTLTLMSRCNSSNASDNTTAMVVNAGVGVVNGAATVQRCWSSTLNPGYGYRHMSSPVANTTIADLTTNGFTPVLNPSYSYLNDTSASVNPPFPNVFFFNEPAAATAGTFLEGYKSPASTAVPMTPMQGFAVYTRPTSVFDFIGTLNNGPVNRQISNNGNTDEGAGWNHVGNPYPSPIDWDQVTIPSGMSTSVSVWRSTGAGVSGNYVQYTNGVGPANSDIIPMGVGFWVRRTSAGNGLFSLSNAARVTSYQNPQALRAQETRPLVELSVAPYGQAALEDRAYVYFEQGATVGGNDDRYDASKMMAAGAVPTLFTRAGNDKLAINGLPEMNGTEVRVPLVANVTSTGIYVLNAQQVINFRNGVQVLLEDALTGTTQDLTVNPVYTFRATAGNTTPRFTLVFTAGRVTGLNDATLQAQLAVYPNPVSNQNLKVELGGLTRGESSVALRLVNTLGQVVAQQEVKVANAAIAAELDVRSLTRGIYTLQVQTNGRTVSRQVVVQ